VGNRANGGANQGSGLMTMILQGFVVYFLVGQATRALRPQGGATMQAPSQDLAEAMAARTASVPSGRGMMPHNVARVHLNAWPPMASVDFRVYLSDGPGFVFGSPTPVARIAGGSKPTDDGRTFALDLLSVDILSRSGGALVAHETGLTYGSPNAADCSRAVNLSLLTTEALRANRTSVWAHVYVSLVGADPDPAAAAYVASAVSEAHVPIVRLLKTRRKKATKHLLGGEEGEGTVLETESAADQAEADGVVGGEGVRPDAGATASESNGAGANAAETSGAVSTSTAPSDSPQYGEPPAIDDPTGMLGVMRQLHAAGGDFDILPHWSPSVTLQARIWLRFMILHVFTSSQHPRYQRRVHRRQVGPLFFV